MTDQLPELTEPERQVHEFVVAYIREHQYPPSMSEIAEAVGRSASTVFATLRRLQEKGWITLDGGPRRLRVVTP